MLDARYPLPHWYPAERSVASPKYGAFLSYTRHDEGPRWVSDFVAMYKENVRRYIWDGELGINLVFLDRLFLAPDIGEDELAQSIRAAITFSGFTVAFQTESYWMESKWCPIEYIWSLQRGEWLSGHCENTTNDHCAPLLVFNLAGWRWREPDKPRPLLKIIDLAHEIGSSQYEVAALLAAQATYKFVQHRLQQRERNHTCDWFRYKDFGAPPDDQKSDA